MIKVPNGHEVIQVFEAFSPKKFAVEGDKIGLQIGSLNKPINRIMTALDVNEDVIEEAIIKNVDLIIAHHPVIFRPLKHIQTDSTTGRMIEKCIKNDITIYAAHTNLDVAEGGVNDLLADALNLQQQEVLSPSYTDSNKKIVVFVPGSSANKVREAMSAAGAGNIGNYSHCTYNTEGVGTFLPEASSHPVIGERGKLVEVEEIKIETIVPTSRQKAVIRAMLAAHPYEEVAYDIYSLENEGKEYGLGRVGYLPNEMTLEDFALYVKKQLHVDGVRVVGPLNGKVKKVAVLGGDGNKYISQAKFKGADVFVTGDLYYHVAHDALMMGLSVVDPGHHIEQIMKKGVADKLFLEFKDRKWDIEVFPSEPSTDPFVFI
ncbi:Nif3-like dinuclear metal center hexameric protein [Litchfieldia salsa]|uniref:GTP cyclohydrolase 1 type 2 homolog n=1 Tax=Litchfieldia salsa TaxID=930152 RepID=A0A1H0VB29_9BACI|nr:Nif3-like dinuclear metal center hexameric protein [Litchfieldia salsa]SDP75445.1 dinuclear metal center protein, YbgI/SA1388 family [Litchfieldia salsa]